MISECPAIVGRLTLALLFLLPSLGTPEARAEESIQVYRLVHHSTAEMIGVLEPLIEEGTRLSGTDNELIVSASESEHARITTLLSRLDTPPKQYLLSVRDGLSRSMAESLLDDRSVRRRATKDATERSASLRLRAGSPAYVETGQILRVIDALYGGFYGAGLVEGQMAVTSGFTVKASARGDDSVALEIAPFSSARGTAGLSGGPAGPSIGSGAADREVRDIETTVVLPLNRWTLLGSTNSTLDSTSTGRRRASTSGSLTETNTLVRVESVD